VKEETMENNLQRDVLPIGYVLGHRPASTLEFFVLVEPGNYLELDDVVYVDSPIEGYPGVKTVRFYGTVSEVSQYHEGIQFDSDTQIVREGILPASLAYVGKVVVTKIAPEIFVSPHPADFVYRARGVDLEEALSFREMSQRIPAGLLRNGEPLYLNFEFLNGAKGAHVSISGISGVATKTTYATFLLYSLLNERGEKGVPVEDKASARVIIFNVKGEDMLFLDKPNAKLGNADREVYAKLGLPVEPFREVAFYTSPRPGLGLPTPSTDQRQEGITPFCWTMRTFAQERLLPFLFADADQETTSMVGCISSIAGRLERAAGEGRGNEPFLHIEGRLIGDLWGLIEALEEDIYGGEDEEESSNRKRVSRWFPSYEHIGTKNAFLRKLRVAAEALQGVIRSDIDDPGKYRIDFDQRRVTVVHLSNLKSAGQKFIVGSTLKRLMAEKERTGRKPYVFVLLDELNKYAPREGKSPIGDILLDIAERGRSLGVVLIGCQQSASSVEKRIIANSSIKVNGRLDFAESQSAEYNYLPGSFRLRSCIVKPGTMILHQPDIPAPVLIRFPMPAWATRSEEVEAGGSLEKEAERFEKLFGS
jgi:DNA helicase HerA-like ATPase